MKIETDNVFVKFEAETNFDIFCLGQIHMSIKKEGLDVHSLIAPENCSASLSIQKEQFISYVIKTMIK
jgi:hypothetical protein